jgi:ABC-type uncharacterized transport system permease subunit
MILLHLAVAALYVTCTWALWPDSAPRPSKPAPAARFPVNGLLLLAVALHAWLALRDIISPSQLDLSLANTPSVVAWFVVVLAWATGLLRTLPIVGAVVLPIAAVASLLPALWVNPHHFSYSGDPLAIGHIVVASIAYALFTIAAVQALVMLGLEKRLHRRLPDTSAGGTMPPLLTLERVLFRLIVTGFVLLTLTLVSGMFFSEQIFGKPVTFTHKVVFSVLAWATFGALLWGRARYGWRGRVAVRWLLTGTGFLFLAYIGYKFVLEVLLGR